MKRALTAAAAAVLAFCAGSAAGIPPPNYQLTAPVRATLAASPAAAERTPAPSRFHWAQDRGPALPLSPLKSDARPDAAARHALHGAVGKLGVTAREAESAELRELHDRGHGPVIARYQQRHNGLPVFGAQLNVVMDRAYRPVAWSGGFAKRPPAEANATPASGAGVPAEFTLGHAAATQAALRDLTLGSKAPGLNLIQPPGSIEPMYYAGAGGLTPAYRLAIRAAQADGAGQYGYGYLVSAVDGTILVRKNLMSDAALNYRAYADATAPFTPFDGALGNGRVPFPGTAPTDNPPRVPADASLVTLQNGPISTDDPWLPAGVTTTQGNNVRAYTDAAAPDGVTGDFYAPTSSPATFDYASTADASPTSIAARRAGIVNMFFVMNWLHDFWYDHGFDEAAGNAQQSNYGRGGLEGDPVLAESQDFSGRNNANMYTPPDGDSPIMQMFLWDGGTATVAATSPALGPYAAGTASFGDPDFDISGGLAAANDGVDSGTDGCQAFAGVTGMIALIDRGNCNFAVKAGNAQAAGAIGALIVNNTPLDGSVNMSGDAPAITIPVMSVSFEAGAELKDALGAGAVTINLARIPGPDRDAALDNGVIAHEFFHYVSDRLVGDAFGLANPQGRGMGEGWSDFASMMLFVRDGDQALPGNGAWTGAYSIGTYVDNSAYFGIRRAPYSTDFAVNPLTFQHIQAGVPLPDTAPLAFGSGGELNARVHSAGEIWANMLWEVYAALLNDPRHTFDEAQSRMRDYVIAGLKLLPVEPTFIDGRNGILAAARATDAEDYVLIAEAFARRGMGAGALGPHPKSTSNIGVTESYVALAGQYAIEDLRVDTYYDDGVVGYCDRDPALDPGETALLGFTVVSTGTLDLEAGATLQVSTDGDVTLPDNGLVTLPALAIGESHAVAMPIVLNSASSSPQPMTLTLEFPDAGGAADAVFEPVTLERPLSANLDLAPTRTSDDMELPQASASDWAVALDNPDSGPPWVTTDDYDGVFSSGTAWYAHDNSTPAVSTLTTPQFHVTGTFSMTFDHFFEFEVPFVTGNTVLYFDGGVVEASINGGAFQDVASAGGSFSPEGYNGVSLAFGGGGRRAFVDTNFRVVTTTLSFGNALAGRNVRLRFRLQMDESVGAFGWVVDNVMLNGIATPVFSGPVPENGICQNPQPLVDAGPDQDVAEGEPVMLAGAATDRNGDTLTYAWSHVSGPGVTLNNATTLTPAFTAPDVSSPRPLTLRLSVSDGTTVVSDDVVVMVTGTGSDDGGGGALGGELALLGLLVLLRRRRPAGPCT